MNKQFAISSLRPNTEWVMHDDDVENIIWITENVKPLTETEVQKEIVRLQVQLQAEADAKVAARENALAKLAALGLTAEEIASL
jgi:hypothetical protein